MAKTFTINDWGWTPLEPGSGENSDIALSTTTARQVTHTEGDGGNPISLTQLASDPAHPFTAGQAVFTAQTVTFRDGSTVDVAHSDDYPRDALALAYPQAAAHTIHSGGFYLADYRVPLIWRAVIAPGTPNNHIEFTFFRRDGVEIDEDDRTDVSITIDPNTDAATPANIVIANGVAEPGAGQGEAILRFVLTDAQLLNLRPVDGNGNRVYRKIGITIAAASSTPVISYSAYDETQPDSNTTEKFLYLHASTSLLAPSSGKWYARLLRPDITGAHTSAKLHVGE